MNINNDVANLLDQVLGLKGRASAFAPETRLLGSLPEIDSITIVSVLTGLEEHFGFTIEDDEISADTFLTLGALVDFVKRKLE